MKKTRYSLLLGLLIILVESLIYGIGFFAGFMQNPHFFYFLLILLCSSTVIFSVLGIGTYNLNKENFKKKKWIDWTAFGLALIFWIYLLTTFILKESSNKIMAFAHLFVIGSSLFLVIIGIKTFVPEKKLSLEEKKPDKDKK